MNAFREVAEILGRAIRPRPPPGRVPPLRRSEVGATVGLLALGVLLAVFGGPALRYAQDAGAQVMAPAGYIEQVRGALPKPGVTP